MTEIVFRLVVDMWRMAKKYQFRRLDDAGWESFTGDGIRVTDRYRPHGAAVCRLARDLFAAFQRFYEQMAE